MYDNLLSVMYAFATGVYGADKLHFWLVCMLRETC